MSVMQGRKNVKEKYKAGSLQTLLTVDVKFNVV